MLCAEGPAPPARGCSLSCGGRPGGSGSGARRLLLGGTCWQPAEPLGSGSHRMAHFCSSSPLHLQVPDLLSTEELPWVSCPLHPSALRVSFQVPSPILFSLHVLLLLALPGSSLAPSFIFFPGSHRTLLLQSWGHHHCSPQTVLQPLTTGKVEESQRAPVLQFGHRQNPYKVFITCMQRSSCPLRPC